MEKYIYFEMTVRAKGSGNFFHFFLLEGGGAGRPPVGGGGRGRLVKRTPAKLEKLIFGLAVGRQSHR